MEHLPEYIVVVLETRKTNTDYPYKVTLESHVVKGTNDLDKMVAELTESWSSFKNITIVAKELD